MGGGEGHKIFKVQLPVCIRKVRFYTIYSPTVRELPLKSRHNSHAKFFNDVTIDIEKVIRERNKYYDV